MSLKRKWRKTGVKQGLVVQTYYTAQRVLRLRMENRTARHGRQLRTDCPSGQAVSLRLGEGLIVLVAQPAAKIHRDTHVFCL
jgi:hypothetical protein